MCGTRSLRCRRSSACRKKCAGRRRPPSTRCSPFPATPRKFWTECPTPSRGSLSSTAPSPSRSRKPPPASRGCGSRPGRGRSSPPVSSAASGARFSTCAPARRKRRRRLPDVSPFSGPAESSPVPPPWARAPSAAAGEKTLPPEVFLDAVGAVSPGDTLDIDAFSARLVTLGYARLPAAADPGDFAVRGGIVDVYSPAHPLPARLLLDGDVVESVRWFHPETQRTVPAGARAEGEPGPGERLVLLPCSQVITREEYLSAASEGQDDRPWSEALRQGIRFYGAAAIFPPLYG